MSHHRWEIPTYVFFPAELGFQTRLSEDEDNIILEYIEGLSRRGLLGWQLFGGAFGIGLERT